VNALDLRPAIPAIIVALTALTLLLSQAFAGKGKHGPYVPLALLGLGAALAATLMIASSGDRGRGGQLGGALSADSLALFLEVVILGVGVLAVLLSSSYLRAIGSERGEHYALLLFSLVGMLGLVAVTELISLFVALEILSVALYALCGSRRDQVESQEAAVKYFITGAFSSAFLLYGIAMLYGISGSTSLGRVSSAVASASGANQSLALLGAGLLLVGFGFKIACVPFHMWAPDVYEGAPTSVTGFMAAGVKVAAFGALIRVFGTALVSLSDDWRPVVAILAALSMIVGNLAALGQSNVKRMLAYSSVAHAGYLLAALVAAPRVSAAAILFYLVGYAAVSLGTFGTLSSLARDRREPLSLDHFSGLARHRPAVAAALTLFLVSLAGVPVSAGFVGKFYLFSAAVSAGYTALAIVGMLMSVVSAYYYLRVVVHMYMKDAPAEDAWAVVAPSSALALALCVVVVLGLGLWPAGVLAFAQAAARSLL
jgi:NADH-quinone oxidoreductase subunit N